MLTGKEVLTQEILKMHLNYDPEIGIFTRRIKKNKYQVGSNAGNKDAFGYIEICVNGVRSRAHRLAWLYVTGEWPKGEIDHINGIKDDNRFCNLRVATRKQNCENFVRATSASKSGVLGVSWVKAREKWGAFIKVCGKTKYLGVFSSKIEAHNAYVKAKKEHHKFSTLDYI